MSVPARTLLVVDDDALLGHAVADYLRSASLETVAVGSAAEAVRVCDERVVHVVLLDQKLPDGDGHALCEPILARHPEAKIIFATAYPSFESAILGLKSGAYDYLCKPFELEQLAIVVRRCLSTLDLERTNRLEAYRSERDADDAVFVGGDGMRGLREAMHLAAGSDAPVLVTGETGTGKTLAVKAVHYAGPRRERPLVSLNCAALPEHLVEAELFGWERGAFTGAVASREGVVEMAEGGTLFLDEIGEMPFPLQAKLLAFLEDRRMKRLGGRNFRTADVRIVAATNADLEARVAARTFRVDLFYRLDVVRLHLPPLRDRAADIPALCDHLLARIAGRRAIPRLADGEHARLMAYSWPGNVRELRNVLERAAVLHRDALRPSEMLAQQQPAAPVPHAEARALRLDEVERRHILATWASHGHNLARTARTLGISLSTLKRRLQVLREGGSSLAAACQ